MGKNVKKIELYSTYDLVADKEKIEKERKTVEDLLKLNELEYTINIEEKCEIDDEKKKHILYINVNEEDFYNVIELFDEYGYLGYSIDEEENEKQEISENNKETEQVINKAQVENFEKENSNSIKLSLTELICILIVILLFITLLTFEISFICDYMKQGNLAATMGMLIIIICEFPILVKIIRKISNKKGK